jgi:hypothetical protein
MPFPAKGALLFLLLYATVISVAPGQETEAISNRVYLVTDETPDLHHKPIASRLLTPNEGLAILSAALDSLHNQSDFFADCSHFVHELYERAGFRYDYASSSDLYEGTNAFRQVASPQPGDLAVWHGHAGIVVNPDQHSFFSVLRSGPAVDSYDSPYWKQRGQPHFFRYLKPVPRDAVSTSIKSVSWQPKVLNLQLHPIHQTAAVCRQAKNRESRKSPSRKNLPSY